MAGRISAVVVVLFVTMVIVEGLKCPVRPRGSRKKQRERLHALQPHHVVVNAKFNGIDVNDRFRFIVNQVWSKNNGQLVVNDEITVGADNANLKPCFNKLALTKYILMLEPVSGGGKHRFMALEPVVLAENHRHKQRVFEALCEKENNRCIMRVIMPAREILYRGSTGILTCDVESTSPLVSVQWLKDGRDVDTATYRAAGLYVQKNSLFDSKLWITTASQLHNGRYQCVVGNEGGERVTGVTRVIVRGPSTDSQFTSCPDPSYCMNGGICRMAIGWSVPSCECPGGFMGERCEEANEDFTIGRAREVMDNSMKKAGEQVSYLTMVVVALSIALAFTLTAAIVYVIYTRRQLNSNKTRIFTQDVEERTEISLLRHQDKHNSLRSNADKSSRPTSVLRCDSDDEKPRTPRTPRSPRTPQQHKSSTLTHSQSCREHGTPRPHIHTNARHSSLHIVPSRSRLSGSS